jgi:serine/threonine-protein kinase
MGSLWTARDRALEVGVAVKFMTTALVDSAAARERFAREARAAAALRSQHVVQILDYGVEGETPYIAMELLHGETLAASLGRHGRISLRAAAPIVVQIAKALGTAHRAGLVHRDLKPSNVFLALKDEEEVVKLLDFGIAKTGAFQKLTAPGAVLGTMAYMSPEQARGSKTLDHRSDLWSLGVLVYRAVTGRFPFPVSCDPAAPVGGEHRLPSPVGDDLPAHLDGFFARALATDPDRRFPSARELTEAFCVAAMQEPAPTIRVVRPPAFGSAPPDADTVELDEPTFVIPGRTLPTAATVVDGEARRRLPRHHRHPPAGPGRPAGRSLAEVLERPAHHRVGAHLEPLRRVVVAP